MPNPVIHFEIIGKDAKKTQAFYADLFGWHVDTNNPMDYGMVDTHAGSGINGGIAGTGEHDKSPRSTFYIEVDDLQKYLDKAETLGGKTIMTPTDVPGGPTLAMFVDPNGIVVGLTKGM